MKWLIFEEEYVRAGAPQRLSQEGISTVGPAVLEHGVASQKERFLPPLASGTEIWCRAWSEPDAGGDPASGPPSGAVRNAGDDGWLLNGHKTWVVQGALAQWCLALFRTDEDHGRHRGLSCFLVAIDSPGVRVRPVTPVGGRSGWAEISFHGVEVPDAQLLGEQGDGWNVAMAPSARRGLGLRSPAPLTEEADRLLELFHQRGSPAAAADAVARALVDAEASALHAYWTATKAATGHGVGPEASCAEIFWSDTDASIRQTALTLLGTEAELEESGCRGWLDGSLEGLSGPIHAALAEVHLSVVAEQLLGFEEG